MDEVSKDGLFDLKEDYKSPLGIIDGGGWNLNIKYVDGEIKKSKGSNYNPSAFEKADYAFFQLYGDDLFNTLPNSYKNPPSLDFSILYKIILDNYSNNLVGHAPDTYTWHGKKVDSDDIFKKVVNKKLLEFELRF